MNRTIVSGNISIDKNLNWYWASTSLETEDKRDLKLQIVLEFSVLSIYSAIPDIQERKIFLENIRYVVIPSPKKFLLNGIEFIFITYGDLIDTLGPNVESGVSYRFKTSIGHVDVYDQLL